MPTKPKLLASCRVYEGTITSDIPNYEEKKYFGLCAPTFIKRFGCHKSDFQNEKHKHSTTLSTEYWNVKEQNGRPKVTWRIVRNARPFSVKSGNCNLCVNEKYKIANYNGNDLLNKRTEVIAKCRHKNKFELARFKL